MSHEEVRSDSLVHIYFDARPKRSDNPDLAFSEKVY
jgi:hypothetical protein